MIGYWEFATISILCLWSLALLYGGYELGKAVRIFKKEIEALEGKK